MVRGLSLVAHGMWFLIRGGTRVLCIGWQILNHWTTREVPLKCICNPASIYVGISWSFAETGRVAKHFSQPVHKCPSEVEQGDTLPSCFCSCTRYSVPFMVHLVPPFSHFLYFLLVIFLFKVTPNIVLKCILVFLRAGLILYRKSVC